MRLALPRRQDSNGPLHKESSPLVAGSNFLSIKQYILKIIVNMITTRYVLINVTYLLTYPFGQKFLMVVLRHRISLEVLNIPTCPTALRFIQTTTQIDKFMT
jgi:hypothetical protein